MSWRPLCLLLFIVKNTPFVEYFLFIRVFVIFLHRF